MHSRILSQWLANRNVIGHAIRAAALVRVVRALLSGGRLALTQLGRSLGGTAYVKHQIKAVDRLLSNPHLQDERIGIYRAIAQTLLVGNRQPIILVDWCDFELGREWLMLKAALPVNGPSRYAVRTGPCIYALQWPRFTPGVFAGARYNATKTTLPYHR